MPNETTVEKSDRDNAMAVTGVLLAAGGASRFRASAAAGGLAVSHKLIAPLRGETVFAWSLRNLLDAVTSNTTTSSTSGSRPLSTGPSSTSTSSPSTPRDMLSRSTGLIRDVVIVQGALDLSSIVEAVIGTRKLKVKLVTNERWAEGQATSLAVAIDTIRAHSTVGHETSAITVGLGDQPFIPSETWKAISGAPIDQELVVATYGGLRRNPVRIAARFWDEIPRIGDEGAKPLLRSYSELVHELACKGDPADIDTVEDLLRWS